MPKEKLTINLLNKGADEGPKSLAKHLINAEKLYSKIAKGNVSETSIRKLINLAKKETNIFQIKKIHQYAVLILRNAQRILFSCNHNDFLKNANKLAYNISLLSTLGEYIGSGFSSRCFVEIKRIDKLVQKYSKKFPQRILQFINRASENTSNKLINESIDIRIFKQINIQKLKSNFKASIKNAYLESELYRSALLALSENIIQRVRAKWHIKTNILYDYKIVLVNKANPKIFKFFNKYIFFDSLIKGKFDQVEKKILDDYKKEQQEQQELSNFDLPKNKRISYLRLFPQKYDNIVALGLPTSSLLAYAFKSVYPLLSSKPPIFTSQFQKDLKRSIAADYKNGVRDFVIDIYSHGNKKGFGWKNISAKTLAHIFRLFPDARFTINTIACYGAGLTKDFPKILNNDPTLKKRISVFTQTKADMTNIANLIFSLKKHKKNIYKIKFETYLASPYYTFFIQALLKGKKYGEAHVYANDKVKKALKLDPEAIINGKLFVDLPLYNLLSNQA